MLLNDLQAAVSPAIALALELLEIVGQQSMAVTLVGVMRFPAKLEDGEPQIRVLADRIARPAAGRVQRRASDQAHRTMHDDGVDFVPLHHADIEEAGIFAVHSVVRDAASGVTMILRRLYEPDLRIGEHRREILEPV